jgi:Mg-chelatase subunit ChlD
MASLISILSTDHGRLRREQRDISKRDVQTAILYGTAERSWGNRWKIEYDGIIFIVNNAKTHEVTAFPAPLALAPLDTNDRIKHTQTRDFLIENPDRCTSHTILVVDNSGSMSTHDINLHRDRQIAAYSVTAMEFIAEQLFKQTATNSDVVTLIEFAGGATEKFRQEPISWALYNKILNCRSTRSFQSREDDDLRDSVNGDTNYMSALEAAAKALDYIVHDRCALSLMFLSDGAPSDAHNLGLTPLAAKRVITAKMEEIALKYKDKLNIQFVGFGSEEQDFSIFENLVEASTKNGAQAEFAYCGKVANQIGCAISSLVSSSTLTRTQLLKSDQHKKYSKREVTLESDIGGKVYWNYHKIIGHYVYNPAEDDFIEYQGLPPGAVIGADDSKNASSTSNVNTSSLPPLLAVSRLPYGKGAERLAYRSSLAYKADEKLHTFNLMVAKETILVERPDDNVEFHRAFCKTQDLASYLAWEFNKCLVAHPSYCKTETPTIVFLPCSVLILDDPEWPGRGVLVEKKLNNEKYEWKKYNDNAGVSDETFVCILKYKYNTIKCAHLSTYA